MDAQDKDRTEIIADLLKECVVVSASEVADKALTVAQIHRITGLPLADVQQLLRAATPQKGA